MDPDRWARVDALFFGALDRSSGERAGFLAAACAGDDLLRQEVEGLLEAHALEDAGEPGTGAAPPAPGPGDRLGPWELEALIGRGGMGEVYRAHRADGAYDLRVAVKLVRAGPAGLELARRFHRERQILARLEHPAIAVLLDGGVTAGGVPWLVMQYVDGLPITEHASRRRLALEERLRLFLSVCEAVRFAHTNLVVHRDLKPSNILVTDSGDVRLLDFGIARLLDAPGDPATTDLLLTPEHAAPEQFQGGPITTATDVYALGVLLYELLAGVRPFQHLPRGVLLMDRTPREPRAPSLAARAPGFSIIPGATPPPVPPSRVQGDLDAIVLKALRPEPGRRYATAGALADDVRRHLTGHPVLARPETRVYTVARFLRRHRIGVLASLAVAASLVALSAGSLRFAAVSRAQAAELARERDVAVEVSDFLEDLFRAPDPYAADANRRDTMPVSALLDTGAERVRADLDDQPLLQARLLTILGRAQRNLGRLGPSETLLREAAVRRREVEPEGSVQVARTELHLAQTLVDRGELDEAETLVRRALSFLPPGSPALATERATALLLLGNTLQSRGRFVDAEAAYREGLDVAERVFPPGDARLATHHMNLATVLSRQARLDEAEPLLRHALTILRAARGSDHPETASALNNLGSVLQDRGRMDEAENLYREALAIRRARLPDPHPATAVSVNNLATLRLQQGDLEGAEVLFREGLELRQALYGTEHMAVGLGVHNLAAVVHRFPHRRGEAEGLYTQARRVLLAAVGPTHPGVADVDANLGRLHHDGGRHEAAVRATEAALAVRAAALDPGHPLVAGTLSDLGRCLMDLGRHAEADVRLQEAFRILQPLSDRQTARWTALLERLVALNVALERPEEASRYESLRREALEASAAREEGGALQGRSGGGGAP